MTQASRGHRRGLVFSVRITPEERARIGGLMTDGPRGVGPWLVWRALRGTTPTAIPAPAARPVLPELASTPVRKRLILDLCGGSGAWSLPYAAAGYPVDVVDVSSLMHPRDVRVLRVPPGVWGVLAAPPCTEFSMARNGHPGRARDFVAGMACVNACMRIILQCKPSWWALENPSGHLSKFLGIPRDTFQPCDFGDSWTKRTQLWGDFTIPTRGPFVSPMGSAMKRPTAAARAITPPGFARAFFESNP